MNFYELTNILYLLWYIVIVGQCSLLDDSGNELYEIKCHPMSSDVIRGNNNKIDTKILIFL